MANIHSANVYLVTRPKLDWAALNKFLSDEKLPSVRESIRSTSIASAIIETAARLCYMSFGKGRTDPAAFINNLLESKHGSVLEHVNYGFIFTGVSRSLSHELVRHRAGFAYSQLSQRYVDESDARFVVPPAMQSLPAEEGFDGLTEFIKGSYTGFVASLEKHVPEKAYGSATERRKAIRQAVRAVLPNATETKIFVTGNVRAWRHFIEMRGSPHADIEIRRLAVQVMIKLKAEAPALFGDFTLDQLPDGSGTTAPAHSKV